MIGDSTTHIKNKLNFSSFELPDVISYIPLPTEYDYSIGKIRRYFVGKPNYYFISEVNSEDYHQYVLPFFIPISFSWKISGPKHNVYKNGILDTVGVYEYNLNNINHMKKSLPNIDKFLNDPLQFWNGF